MNNNGINLYVCLFIYMVRKRHAENAMQYSVTIQYEKKNASHFVQLLYIIVFSFVCTANNHNDRAMYSIQA